MTMPEWVALPLATVAYAVLWLLSMVGLVVYLTFMLAIFSIPVIAVVKLAMWALGA